MLSSLCILALLATQRGGQTETKPASAPADTPGTSVRQVTAGYFRMNDPGFVARVVEGATSSRGRQLAGSVLPPEMLLKRDALLTAYRPYLQNFSRTRVTTSPPRIGAVTMPGNGRPPQIDKTKLDIPEIVDDSDAIKIVYEDTTQGVELGTVVQDAKGESTFDVSFVAHKNGVLSVQDTLGNAIDAAKLMIYSGEVKDGVAQTTSSTPADVQSGKKYPIKKGQEYAVRLRMRLDQTGDFTETVVVRDDIKRTLKVHGRVVAPSGNLSCWIEQGDFYLVPGTTRSGKLHVVATGNAPTTVYLNGTAGLTGTTFIGGSRSVKAKDDLVIPFTVRADKTAPNGAGTLNLKLTGYDSKSTATAQTSVKVETLWTEWTGIQKSSGNVKMNGSFRYSSAGDWDISAYGKTSSKVYGDFLGFGVVIDTPLSNGKRLAALVSENLSAALQPGPSSKTFGASGFDQRLVGTTFVNSYLTATVMVDGTLASSNMVPWIEYWIKSKNVTALNGNTFPFVTNPD
jgi:hypothetical protein